MEAENEKLKAENEKSKTKQKEKEDNRLLKLLSKEIEKKVHEILSPIFTSGQIKKLLHPNKKKIIWSRHDIANAIALRSVSPKCYRFMRKKNFLYQH